MLPNGVLRGHNTLTSAVIATEAVQGDSGPVSLVTLYGENDPAVGVVVLRRYDRSSLRVWALSTDRFCHEERFKKLLEVTGGWPMLVEDAAALVSKGNDEHEALQAVAAHLESPTGAATLVDAVGLTADENLSRAFEATISLVDLGPISRSYLMEAIGEVTENPGTVLDCLAALQVFNVDAHGLYELEPLLVRAWSHRSQ